MQVFVIVVNYVLIYKVYVKIKLVNVNECIIHA